MSGWVFLLLSRSHSHSFFTWDNRRLRRRWRLAGPLRSAGSSHQHRRPLWAGSKTLSSLIRKFVSWISRPCSTRKIFYKASTTPFNEARQAVRRRSPPPRDRMLNEKLRATRAVCYHSICLRPQTGHYPAIIFLDLQSRVEEAVAAACSPLGGTDGNQLENLHLHDPAEQLIRSGYLFST